MSVYLCQLLLEYTFSETLHIQLQDVSQISTQLISSNLFPFFIPVGQQSNKSFSLAVQDALTSRQFSLNKDLSIRCSLHPKPSQNNHETQKNTHRTVLFHLIEFPPPDTVAIYLMANLTSGRRGGTELRQERSLYLEKAFNIFKCCSSHRKYRSNYLCSCTSICTRADSSISFNYT